MKSKVLSAVIALLASLFLWLYVVTVVNPEDSTTIQGIPVTFFGEEEMREEKGLIITEGAGATVSLSFDGKRSALQKLRPENITVQVDVSRVRKSGEYKMSYSYQLPSNVSSNDVSVIERMPDSVSFTVELLSKKPVEVKGVLDGTVAENYMADPMTFNYNEVIVEGPESIVSTIQYAQVILSREDLDQTVTMSLPYTLINENGEPVDTEELTMDVEEIEVTLPVLAYKEIPLSVEYLDGGGATGKDVITEIDPPTITVAGDPARLGEVNQIVLGNIDLGEIAEDGTTIRMPVAIPNDLRNISGDEEAEVTISFRGLATKVIRLEAGNMRFENAPEDLVAMPRTQMLQVTIRAAADVVDRLTAADFRVVADVSGLTIGSHTVPVTIVNTSPMAAGVIGEYSIVVALEPEQPPIVEPGPDVEPAE